MANTFSATPSDQTVFMKQGMKYKAVSSNSSFKFMKENVTAWSLFSCTHLIIKSMHDDLSCFTLLDGQPANGNVLTRMYRKWLASKCSRTHKQKISPFQDHLFSISFEDGYHRKVDVASRLISFDQIGVVLFITGNVLFLLAPLLSRSVMFHYSSGISIGMLMAWLILIVMLVKMLPFKRLMTASLVASGSIGAYFTDYILQN